MGVPISQMWSVARHVLGNKLRGRERYPLVLMLEPLFRCNLACAGCGKIQHPADVLRQNLSPEECFRAAEECGAPIVSIPGGEPLLHPEIAEIVAGLVERKRYIYLCTNALKLEEMLSEFKPSKYLAFSVHLDGPRDEHDRSVCHEGTFDIAVAAIRAAINAGHRVTTNSTLFDGADVERYRDFFDEMMELGVEGMMISPGYPYEKAPDQEHFLHRRQTESLFRRLLDRPKRGWRFNHSPLFLEFLKGNWELECTAWGNPTYNVFGWQQPCYLLDEGYVETFAELLEDTDWSSYGHRSGNPKCQDCMVHCGYEPTSVAETFGTLLGLAMAARIAILGPPKSTVEEQVEVAPATTNYVPLPVIESQESTDSRATNDHLETVKVR